MSKINVLICLIIFRTSHKIFDRLGGGERVCACVCPQMFFIYLLSSLRSRRPEPACVTQGLVEMLRQEPVLWPAHMGRGGDVALLLSIYFRSRAEHLSGPSLGLVRERVFSGTW